MIASAIQTRTVASSAIAGRYSSRIRSSNLSLSAASRTRLLTMSTPTFTLDEFVLRQFDDPNYSGAKIDYDKPAFEAEINKLHESGDYPLVDGYAPFCKHLFVPNVRARRARVEAEPR